MSQARSQNRVTSRSRPYIPSQFYEQNHQNRDSTPISFHSSHHQPPHSKPPPQSNQSIPIPSAIPPIIPQQDVTPLPTLPIVVLCFAMISEFLSASVSGPFIFFMIEDFGVGGGEAAVGFWAGIVSSVFFLSQFLTSLLWSNVSNKHGRRVVLFSSLLGNAITLILFGSSTSLGMAICARLGQGIFNGAIGVARGAVRDLTDSTNEGSAIAWIGLCWGMGGIAGPIIGGLLEHPAENYPSIFGRFQLLKDYPYLLPCTVASSITFIGAILSLFLGWDGGYRTGKIQLTDSTKLDQADRLLGVGEEEDNETSFTSPGQHISLLRSPNLQAMSLDNQSSHSLNTGTTSRDPSRSIVIGGPNALSRTTTRQSNTFVPGSAYGYDRHSTLLRRPSNWRQSAHVGSVRSGHFSTVNRRNSRAISLARSFGGGTQYAPDYEDLNGEENVPALNFAQRLLLANEDAVFGLHDVWLAAATTQDREDEYSQMEDEQDGWDGSIFEDDDSRLTESGMTGYEDSASISGPSSFDDRGRSNLLQHPSSQRLPSSRRPSASVARGSRPDMGLSPRHSFAADGTSQAPASALPPWLEQKMRTTSMASSIRPAIFGNTGLATPRSMSQNLFVPPHSKVSTSGNDANTTSAQTDNNNNNNLSVIPEGRSLLNPAALSSDQNTIVDLDNQLSDMEDEKPTGLFNQLPLAIIAQYAILALHGTTCDQIFMSFLVTPIRSGGLGLSAGHYAELIAAMCIAQIVFQFRFYPTVGPPRGKLTHLSMFRLGLCLYIPVYMLLPELRGLLRENHNGLVMFGMILLCTFRWLGNVCAYTSVMVMINAQTPPHLIPLANGLAQSAVSASRFVGPVFGGMVWSFSITPTPDYRAYPFNNSLGFLIVSVICFTGLCLSFKLK
ncbi:hypothetical protein MJO28_002839 [Puccinia striiformis f. sp. tritici]|uniref:Uncharacterized protein n=1 Tax=Puccinia striiformis f. sp. tritici TaxID=168172 RepID=A0ACC0ERH3_9BASI|nr:hypothetical protein MJO28_002839 [Puccinia striiformis f. sp. tritici]